MLLSVGSIYGVWAQSCNFRLELYDTFGDGWNGAFLTVIINGDSMRYTLDNQTDNGEFRAFSVPVNDGDTVTLIYTRGGFDNEAAYAIYNPENILVYAAGPNPLAGIPLRAFADCPSCLVSNPDSVKIIDERAFIATIGWDPSTSSGRYLIEYGKKGFMQGTGTFINTPDTILTIRNLQEKTNYEFYLATICAGNDTSRFIGPYAFQTRWAKDVGVTAIVTPQTQCAISPLDSVTITLKNFGGNPQSLFEYNFSVNGVPGGVTMPADGLFTGVLGKDSTFTLPFDTRYNFSRPGIYEIKAWTKLKDDRDSTNDTTTVIITNIPLITQYPYFEDFETWSGGWTIGTNSKNPSWEYGKPAGRDITAAAGGLGAWVTNLDGNYNDSELSYLVSPCLNFASLSQDPRLTFSLFLTTEACCDEGWLEMSLDGGATWTKVDTAGTGINWYNDLESDWWDGDAGVEGWHTVSTILKGTAGQADVRLRFVFSSDFSTGRDGMAIDNIFITAPLQRDLLSLTVKNTSTEDCGSPTDKLALSILNLGTTPATAFTVGYRINGGAPVIENVDTFSIAPNTQRTYNFKTAFNSTNVGIYDIQAWVALNNDGFRVNDTVYYNFSTTRPIPFAENFETGGLPTGWKVDAFTGVGQGHGNRSYVLSDNLSASDRSMEVVTPPIGLIQMGDSLTFQYRIVNFTGNGTVATTLGARDTIAVQISSDCGVTYQTEYVIRNTTHRADTALQRVVVFLNAYAGKAIRVRLLAGWGAGDYWVDFDNINIVRCPASLNLSAEVKNETVSGASDGQVSVVVGRGDEPFTYQWSNGGDTKTIVRIPGGNYQVTVTDRYGCRDVANVRVGVITGLEEPARINRVILQPNPTAGPTLLRLELREMSDVNVQVFSTDGRLIFQARERNGSVFDIPLDLSNHPAGIYIVRLQVNNEIHSEKLVKF